MLSLRPNAASKPRGPVRGRPGRVITLALVASLLLTGFVATPLAYEAEVHYIWTYYLALHVGFTERQAYQIASATYAIDWDPDTGPMEAKSMDVIFASERELYRTPVQNEAADKAWVEAKEVLGRINPQLPSVIPGFLEGLDWKTWMNGPRLRIRNVWSRFHAFAESELVPSRSVSPFVRVSREERVQNIAGQLFWDWLPPLLTLIPLAPNAPEGLPQVLERFMREKKPGSIGLIVPEVSQQRQRSAMQLWDQALAERNPGPYVHFVQDAFSHRDFDNIRGHALFGHWPDFLSAQPERARTMTLATLHALCLFRDELLSGRDATTPSASAPGWPRGIRFGSEFCAYLDQVALRGRPKDPMEYSMEDFEPFQVGRQDSESARRLARIFEVLDQLMGVNPAPDIFSDSFLGRAKSLVNWDPSMGAGKLADMINRLVEFETLGLVQPEIKKIQVQALLSEFPSEPSALGVVRRAIVKDMDSGGLLPAVKSTSLEAEWGEPPGRSCGVVRPERDAGLGCVVWYLPDRWKQYAFNGEGMVMLAGPTEYVGGRSFLAGIENLPARLDDPNEAYPVETVEITIVGQPTIKMTPAARPCRRSADCWTGVEIGFEYSISGVKSLATDTHGTGSEAPIPMPAVEACTLDVVPYGQRQEGYRRDDWGDKIKPTNIEADGRYEANIEFLVNLETINPQLIRSGLTGSCAIHVYGHDAVKVPFRVPGGTVSISRMRRGGR